MSDNLYIASGFLAFLLCAAVHYAVYALMWPRVRVPDLNRRREVLVRWFVLLAVWEVTVVALVILYFLAARGGRHGLGTWTAPALGALAGNLISLQLAVIAISRVAR